MKNKLLTFLIDKVVLRPSMHPIHAAGKRHVLSYGKGQLEVWTHSRGALDGAAPSLFVLEFPGTASRAEEPSDFLDGCWSDTNIEIWSVNPPGYGGSSGRASLEDFPSMADHAFDELRSAANGSPIVVAGSSLGTVSALYLASRREVNGVLLQNPPDLREVILSRGDRWPIRWAAKAMSSHLSEELDSILNASQATAPAVFVIALQDRIVPTKIQQRVLEAYAGPKRVIELPDADHDTQLTEEDMRQIQESKAWLHDVVLKGQGC